MKLKDLEEELKRNRKFAERLVIVANNYETRCYFKGMLDMANVIEKYVKGELFSNK